MADILHDFPIAADSRRVFDAVSASGGGGLDGWWTIRSVGTPEVGSEYQLWFGPEYDWRAQVSRCEPLKHFELQLSKADDDWKGTRVGFELVEDGPRTHLRFRHVGWPTVNDHFRTSSYCWAMYLRVLRRWLEYGEEVPYERRLEV